MAMIPMRYEGGGTKTYAISSTYAASTGAVVTLRKKGNNVVMSLAALQNIPRQSWVDIATIMDADFIPSSNFNLQVYDSNNDTTFLIGILTDGTIRAFSPIATTSVANLGSPTLQYFV